MTTGRVVQHFITQSVYVVSLFIRFREQKHDLNGFWPKTLRHRERIHNVLFRWVRVLLFICVWDTCGNVSVFRLRSPPETCGLLQGGVGQKRAVFNIWSICVTTRRTPLPLTRQLKASGCIFRLVQTLLASDYCSFRCSLKNGTGTWTLRPSDYILRSVWAAAVEPGFSWSLHLANTQAAAATSPILPSHNNNLKVSAVRL